jgi:methionyl-tRNA formyltransferase
MRLIFAGTPAFSVPTFHALRAAGHQIVLVLTQPDRPAGRRMQGRASPVKQAALEQGITVYQPVSLASPEAQQPLSAAVADAMIVVAYGLILPQAVLDLPSLGALNIHPSLLPRWRGAAPIQRAILAGDDASGVCIMQMDAGLDTGPVLLRESLAVAPDETAGSLHDRLAALGAELMVRALDAAKGGSLRPAPQPEQGATYAHKINKAEARIDWSRSAEQIERQVRAFDPAPGAVVRLRGKDLKIWQAKAIAHSIGAPGTVTNIDAEALTVACAHGALRISQLQRPGGRRLAAAEVLRGLALSPGERFETDSSIA